MITPAITANKWLIGQAVLARLFNISTYKTKRQRRGSFSHAEVELLCHPSGCVGCGTQGWSEVLGT